MLIKIFFRGFGGVIFLFGVILFMSEFNKHQKQNSDLWLQTNGLIITTTVKENRSRKGVSWCPKVIYSYSVNGIDHESDDIGYQSLCSLDKLAAEHAIKQYKKGNSILVHYLPEAPETSVLTTEYSQTGYLTFLAALFTGGFGLLLIFIRVEDNNSYKQ